MNLQTADAIAHRLVSQHLAGQGWRIRWNNNRGRMGVCKHSVKTLEFSALLFRHIDENEVVDTITHEIAHAMVGPGQGHNWVWACQHRALGGSGNRAWSNADVSKATAKHLLQCRNEACTFETTRNRLTQKVRDNNRCPRCRTPNLIISSR
jgi:predicted SprT family Zn-dependent metalloprotease